MGMQVIFHDIETKLSLGNARAALSLDDLLERADIVTAARAGKRRPRRACSATAQTGEDAARRAPDQRLARHRGRHRRAGRRRCARPLVGAALDVFPVELKGNDDAFVSPLIGCDNVILTPHGGSTLEAQENIGRGSGGQAGALQRQRLDPVGGQLPEVTAARTTPPAAPAAHPPATRRACCRGQRHLRASHGVNIDGQFLRTDPKVGYGIDVPATDLQAVDLEGSADGHLRHSAHPRFV